MAEQSDNESMVSWSNESRGSNISTVNGRLVFILANIWILVWQFSFTSLIYSMHSHPLKGTVRVISTGCLFREWYVWFGSLVALSEIYPSPSLLNFFIFKDWLLYIKSDFWNICELTVFNDIFLSGQAFFLMESLFYIRLKALFKIYERLININLCNTRLLGRLAPIFYSNF